VKEAEALSQPSGLLVVDGGNMKTLIVEDDFLARSLLSTLLSEFGVCHVAVNGKEALAAIERAFAEKEPYDLVCLDIMMPVLDGQSTLLELRKAEAQRGIHGVNTTKVIMVTAIDDSQNIMMAFRQGQCEAYLTKPLDRTKLLGHVRDLGLIP
jgi:two-component system chemotaxis response regulator CheY